MSEEQPEPVPVGDNLSIVGRGYTTIPVTFGRQYGAKIKNLDLSHNKLENLDNINMFANLKSLILDNNELTENVEFPDFYQLDTLCINNNKIADLRIVLDRIKRAAPNLRYLSLLKNPACPNRLIGMEDDDYSRYRLYVIWRIPNLKFLDATPVTPKEKDEALRRGEFCLPAATTEIVATAARIEGQMGATDELTQSVPQSSTHFGVCQYYYQGKQSEGNRFIRNQNL
ncbi:putative Leucine-rich melanocyte differentiation-associated protein [Blattamonas nauphoetae]|uniref:Leucine-rich melanocyte differentiation-associated protein n=1 Tax=Blattamonas nauphoetae TaxID=2049346 RepID=A0ABQ9YBX8_9EUKA|nr:putative Leucine-rich melanocyte differentiation-associated protein [Blattamonas nauphoetae]